MIANGLFTSESVSEGHPDKVADQISDAIVDAALREDPQSRVACEVLVKTGMVMVAGEMTTETYIDVEDLARNIIADIGYRGGVEGFDAKTCAVITAIGKQSVDIAQGVDRLLKPLKVRATKALCSVMQITKHQRLCRRRSIMRTS